MLFFCFPKYQENLNSHQWASDWPPRVCSLHPDLLHTHCETLPASVSHSHDTWTPVYTYQQPSVYGKRKQRQSGVLHDWCLYESELSGLQQHSREPPDLSGAEEPPAAGNINMVFPISLNIWEAMSVEKNHHHAPCMQHKEIKIKKKRYLILFNACKLLNKGTQCFSLQCSLISLGQLGSVALEKRIKCKQERDLPDLER